MVNQAEEGVKNSLKALIRLGCDTTVGKQQRQARIEYASHPYCSHMMRSLKTRPVALNLLSRRWTREKII